MGREGELAKGWRHGRRIGTQTTASKNASGRSPDTGHVASLCPEAAMQRTSLSRDRRVTRSKAALHDALMSLMRTTRYEAITVAEICDAANVGRSTFYEHYDGKDDLKRDGLGQLRERLADLAARGRGETFAFSLPMFEHAREFVHHYRALAGGRAAGMVLGNIRQMLCELVRAELALRASSSGIEREPAVQCVVGAYMSLLTWWLDGGAQLPPAQMDAAFRHVIGGETGKPAWRR
ncbi:MAG TPA: TetR/AcrR family transcriptional regulator [Burkholderiaceae bacterium]